MQFINNEPEQIEIRRSQNTLIVVGSGTILFSVWSTVRMLGLLILLRSETVSAFKDEFGPVEDLSDTAYFWTITVVIMLILAVILAIRVYVGLSAIAEGRGKKRGILYILIAVIMIIVSLWSFLTVFFTSEAPEQMGALTRDHSISTLIIDATSIIMLAQMVVSALKIRKFTDAESKVKD